MKPGSTAVSTSLLDGRGREREEKDSIIRTHIEPYQNMDKNLVKGSVLTSTNGPWSQLVFITSCTSPLPSASTLVDGPIQWLSFPS